MTRYPLRPTHVALAAAALLSGAAFAAPGASSAYRTDAQNTHVEDATSRGVNQVNMITCFMSAMRPDALVNQPSYIALVDENKCDPERRSSTGNSGSTSAGANAPSYMKAIVNSSRSSNSVAPTAPTTSASRATRATPRPACRCGATACTTPPAATGST